jgi:replicative DNA helicase
MSMGFGNQGNGGTVPPWEMGSFLGQEQPPAYQPGSRQSAKIPPHSLEAERSVLGAVLLKNEAIYQVIEVGVEARDFYHSAHQKIFEVVMALSQRNEPVDLLTLTNGLKDRQWYEAVGGASALTALLEETFAVSNVAHYAQIIRSKAQLRRMIDTCTDIVEESYGPVEDMESFMDEAEKRVFGVSDTKSNKTFSTMTELLVGAMTRIEELANQKQEVTGVSTGFKDFDRLTTGLHPGQIVVLAARPGMGKTSWFLSALQHAAVKDKKVVALFSLEMSKEELCFKMISGLARINARNLKQGRLLDRDWQRLAQAADDLSKCRIAIDDSGSLTVMDVRARCRRLLAMEKRLDLIVIDYLQLMKGSKSSSKESNREQEISGISRGLKELAKELGVPIIVLSQLNRGVENRQDKRPMLSDLRESGAIEQDADMVVFIHREDYYNKETEQKGIAEIIIAKNRAGETDTVKLGWVGEFTLFVNLAEESSGMPVYPQRTVEKGGPSF